ncbi:hypothetical protein [Rhodococcus sp. NPDC049939]|uniref:hypothetical protein n=1 Tax=Rhodococcus sp. NPDC049939 TaxID=3155511 RepID=UPI0033C3D432
MRPPLAPYSSSVEAEAVSALLESVSGVPAGREIEGTCGGIQLWDEVFAPPFTEINAE